MSKLHQQVLENKTKLCPKMLKAQEDFLKLMQHTFWAPHSEFEKKLKNAVVQGSS